MAAEKRNARASNLLGRRNIIFALRMDGWRLTLPDEIRPFYRRKVAIFAKQNVGMRIEALAAGIEWRSRKATGDAQLGRELSKLRAATGLTDDQAEILAAGVANNQDGRVEDLTGEQAAAVMIMLMRESLSSDTVDGWGPPHELSIERDRIWLPEGIAKGLGFWSGGEVMLSVSVFSDVGPLLVRPLVLLQRAMPEDVEAVMWNLPEAWRLVDRRPKTRK